ncbi:MAG: AraC family transcriptional regulator [Methylobacteriaceae bacterium]|jgi:AraC family transcriptional regulator of adaptative response/methylated-DNA-[protein]-cysteine methyltransferase|nr:AraC family transcriptional regulator [Methylobacteriaceae bacterium]
MTSMIAERVSTRRFLTDEERWQAVVDRNRAADGAFFFSVRTTGVYCRPSCGARLPRRENVAFHASPADAEAAGFRACLRCKPNLDRSEDAQAKAVARACRAIEEAEEPPTLEVLAKMLGQSPWHFHRVFKSVTGVTPKAYADAHRGKRVRDELKRAGTVTEAIYSAGFNSNGRFYAASDDLLGMKPTDFREGGAGATIRFAVGECSLGAILVAATDKGVCAITLGDDAQTLVRAFQDDFPNAQLVGGDRDFERIVAAAVCLVEGSQREFKLPLDVRGTAFQQRVWQALRDIPAGKTASYRDIAAKIGAPASVRAVAGACASNRIAVAIPCHRVVRTDGSLSGYRWGVERKRALLQRESQIG